MRTCKLPSIGTKRKLAARGTFMPAQTPSGGNELRQECYWTHAVTESP
jgi:hypothetical protein